MSPHQFWRTTPRKFHALCKKHVSLNSPQEKSNKEVGDSSSIGAPDSFIDQLPYM